MKGSLIMRTRELALNVIGGRGERQVSKHLSGIRPDHVVRYELAAREVAEGALVLDAACGIGYGTCYMAQHSPCSQVVGVDRSILAIAFARRYYRTPKAVFRRADCLKLRADPGSYDVITSFETIEHIPAAELLLERFHVLLKANGRLILSTPNEDVLPFSTEHFPHHVRHFRPAELNALLSDAGFEVVSVLAQVSNRSKKVVPGWNGLFSIVFCRKLGAAG